MKSFVALKKIGISQFFQMQLNVYLARYLPVSILRLYLYMWGFLFITIRLKMCIDVLSSLTIICQSSKMSSLFSRKFFLSLLGTFEHYLEKMVMAYRPLNQVKDYLSMRLSISNRHMLDLLARKGKGAILITGHFGAVEYLPISLAMNGYRVAMICRFKTVTLKKALLERAAKFGVLLIDADESGVVFKAIKAIKDGRFLITECDEFSEWRFHRTKTINVFSVPVPRDRTLDFFYKKARVPAFLTLMHRTEQGYTLTVDFLADDRGHKSVSKKAWMKLEEYVLNSPHQWYQIKGTHSFLKKYRVELSVIEDRKDKHITDTNPVFNPSFS